jgi:hypothetical protein
MTRVPSLIGVVLKRISPVYAGHFFQDTAETIEVRFMIVVQGMSGSFASAQNGPPSGPGLLDCSTGAASNSLGRQV